MCLFGLLRMPVSYQCPKSPPKIVATPIKIPIVPAPAIDLGVEPDATRPLTFPSFVFKFEAFARAIRDHPRARLIPAARQTT